MGDYLSGKENVVGKRDRLLLLDIIFNEHSYTKPFEAHPDFNRIHSAKVLKLESQEQKPKGEDDDVDVTTVLELPAPVVTYDEAKARSTMTELERCLNTLIAESTDEDEKISRAGWNSEQATFFDKVYKTILNYQLARLSYDKNPNEPVLRRLALDKAIKRIRSSFAGVAWDAKLTSWIHCVLIDGLGSSLFLCYLEILQGLKSKVPTLVERLFTSSTPSLAKRDLFNSLTLTNALRKSWDPCIGLSTSNKTDNSKEQELPYLLLIPSGPSISMATTKRARFWHSHLSSFGKPVPVNMHTSRAVSEIAVRHFLENMISAVRSKIIELKTNNPERKLVLTGWHIGALVACQVALLDHVAAVICLGFPSVGLNGERQVTNDPYSEVKYPVMFVIGSHSPVSPIDNVEALRERMKTNTQLVVVEGGDELLKLNSSHKKRLVLTQSMVDKLIIDEIQMFLRVALSPENSKSAFSSNNSGGLQSSKAKAERKRKLKRALISKHVNIEQKKKKKVNPMLKLDDVANTHSKLIAADKTQENDDEVRVRPSALTGDDIGQRSDNKSDTRFSSEAKTSTTDMITSSNSPLTQSIAYSTISKDGTKRLGYTILPQGVGGSSAIISALKGNQTRVISKKTGKPLDKVGKKPKSRKIVTKTTIGSTGAFTKVSEAGTITLQSFPPGSVLLSGGGSHVRFHRGTSIFYVPSSSGPTPIIRSSSLITTPSSKTRQLLVTSSGTLATTRAGTTVINATNAPIATVSSRILGSGTTTTVVTSSVPSSTSQDNATKSLGTQLSQTDIQYLANIISKQKMSRSSNEKPSNDSQSSTERSGSLSTPLSPISTKISIGTLSNLNATENLKRVEAAHGVMLKDFSKDTNCSQQADRHPTSAEAKARTENSGANETVLQGKSKNESASSSKGPVIAKVAAPFTTQAQATKTVPVTLTIPLSSLPGNFAIQPNSFSLKALPKGSNAKVVSKIGTSSTSTLSALLSQQKFVLSPVSAASSAKVGDGKLPAVVSKDGLKTTLTTTQTSVQPGILNASVQVSTKQGQVKQQNSNPLTNFVKAPATITLHLPSSALLKDPKFGKDGNSQIKFIGLLNTQGRSPISSPIHFSNLKTRSAPVSPSGASSGLTVSESVVSSTTPASQPSGVGETPKKRENGMCSLGNNLNAIRSDPKDGADIKTGKMQNVVDNNKTTTIEQLVSKKLETSQEKFQLTDATTAELQSVLCKVDPVVSTDGNVDSRLATPKEKEE